MNSNIYMAYKRELRWVAVKRFLQDTVTATGAALLFVVVVTAIPSWIELLCERLK